MPCVSILTFESGVKNNMTEITDNKNRYPFSPPLGHITSVLPSLSRQNTLSLMVVTTPHEILEIDVKSWLNKDTGTN